MEPLPDDAKVRTPGFSRASATKSLRDFAGTFGFAISRNGVLAIVATVRKSWTESKDRLGLEARIHRLRTRICHEQRVSVGGRLGDGFSPDDPGRTRAVLDDDRLAPFFGQQLSDLAGKHVGGASRRLR